MPINEISWNEEAEGSSSLLESPALADFKDVNGLAKAFLDTKSLVGQSLRVPSKEAGEEDIKKFHEQLMEKVPGLIPAPDITDDEQVAMLMKKLGMPEDIDGYEVPEIDGIDLPDDRIKFMKEVAMNSNLTKNQFKKLSELMLSADKESITEAQTRIQQEIEGLRSEWGAAFESKYSKAIKMAEVTGAPKELVQLLVEKKAPVETVKWLDSLVGSLGSEDFQMAVQDAGDGGITPSEARERANELRNKIHNMSPSDPSYKTTLDKIMAMDKLARAS